MPKPKFGIKDCSIRLLYKMTSQKLIAFVFASAAIAMVLIFSYRAKSFTAEVAMDAVRAIKEIAIALLAVRLGQGAVAGYAARKTSGCSTPEENGEPK